MSRRKFVCHIDPSGRNSAKMQRWIDTYFASGGSTRLAEKAAREMQQDTSELEVTFLSRR